MPKYVYVGKSKIFWKHFSVMLADYCHVGVTGSAKRHREEAFRDRGMEEEVRDTEGPILNDRLWFVFSQWTREDAV